MAIRPTPGYAVLKRIEKESTTPSGLIVTSLTVKDNTRAKVVAIHYPEGHAPVAVMDSEVIVKYNAGQPVKVDDKEFVIVAVDDIIAVIE